MERETKHDVPRLLKRLTEVVINSAADVRDILSVRNIVLAALVSVLGCDTPDPVNAPLGTESAPTVIDKRTDAPAPVIASSGTKSVSTGIEKRTEFIKKMVAGYLDFGKTIAPKLASITNAYLRNLIINTFALVEENEGRGDPNYERFLRDSPEAGRDITFLDKDEPRFFYGAMTVEYMRERRSTALFRGPIRLMQIRSDLDPQNMINRLTVMHELVHVEQDNKIRRSKSTKSAYYEQEGTPGRDTTLRESEARACEVELANAYLDGMLKQSFKDPEYVALMTNSELESIVNDIMQRFGAREDQKREINALTNLSGVYYINGGAQEERLPPMFARYVRDAYK